MAIDLGTIGAISVLIGGDATPLNKALGDAEKRLGETKQSMDAVVLSAGAVAAAAAAAAVTIAVMTKRAIDAASALHNQAQSTGIAVSALSEYEHIAALAGISSESFTTSIARLNRNLLEASAGTGEAQKAFAALGISVRDANGNLKTADQVMEEVAKLFSEMEDGAAKSGLAMMIFGRAGAQMIPMLNKGSDGLRQARQDARDFGAVLSATAAAAANDFNDKLTTLGLVQKATANRLMEELLPTLNEVADMFVKAARESGSFREQVEGLAKFVKSTVVVAFQTIAVVGSDVAFVFKMVGGEIGVIAAQFAALARGDFKGAKLIGEEWKADAAQARKDLDEFQKRIMELGNTPPPLTINALSDELAAGAPKKKGPTLPNTEALEKEKDRTKKILEEDAANWVKHADQVFEAAERELETIAKIREDRQKDIDAIRESLMTEEQVLAEHYQRRIEQLIAARDAGVITQEEMDALEEGLAMKHQEELTKIQQKGLSEREKFQRMGLKDQAKTIFGELEQITSGVAQHNKALFQINKVAGIANAVINAYEGISKTMAKYPYPLSIGMAALQGLAAFAQVRAIASAQFEGGGGSAAPALAGGTAAPPVTPVSAGGQVLDSGVTNITLVGDSFSEKQVRALLKEVADARRSGSRINVQ